MGEVMDITFETIFSSLNQFYEILYSTFFEYIGYVNYTDLLETTSIIM